MLTAVWVAVFWPVDSDGLGHWARTLALPGRGTVPAFMKWFPWEPVLDIRQAEEGRKEWMDGWMWVGW